MALCCLCSGRGRKREEMQRWSTRKHDRPDQASQQRAARLSLLISSNDIASALSQVAKHNQWILYLKICHLCLFPRGCVLTPDWLSGKECDGRHSWSQIALLGYWPLERKYNWPMNRTSPVSVHIHLWMEYLRHSWSDNRPWGCCHCLCIFNEREVIHWPRCVRSIIFPTNQRRHFLGDILSQRWH